MIKDLKGFIIIKNMILYIVDDMKEFFSKIIFKYKNLEDKMSYKHLKMIYIENKIKLTPSYDNTNKIILILSYVSGLAAFWLFFSADPTFPLINGDQVDKFFTGVAFQVIIPSLITILAIVFTLSQFIISSISSQYSTQLLKSYEDNSNNNNLFINYLLIIIFSSLILFSYKAVNIFISTIGAIYCVFLFIFSFRFLVDYIKSLFDYINPSKFGFILENDIIQNILNQNEKEVSTGITAMADISLKSMENYEERVSFEYIDHIYSIFPKFLKIKNKHPSKYPIVSNWLHEENNRNNILEYILEEYIRIYRESTNKKKEKISRSIISNLNNLLRDVLESEDDSLIKQLLETRSIFYNKHYEFLEIAEKNKDPSAFKIISFLIHLVNSNYNNPKIKDKYLKEILISTLFRFNQLIIDNNDFELYKKEIDLFSKSMLESPINLQKDFINEEIMDYENKSVLGEFILQNKKLRRNKSYIKFLVEYPLLKNLKSIELIIDKTNELNHLCYIELQIQQLIDIVHVNKVNIDSEDFNEFVLKNIKGIENSKFRIRNKLNKFFISSLLYRTFFMIESYILFKKDTTNFRGIKYIQELWTHTNPNDQDSEWLNEPPITFNAFWMLNLYIFGLIGDETWLDHMEYKLEDFHEIKPYMIQYLIICLTNSNIKGLFPDSNKLIGYKESGKLYELKYWYDFITRFLNKENELKRNFEILIKDSKKWDDLLSYEKCHERVTAENIFKNKKKEIQEVLNNSRNIQKEIVRLMPINKEKILNIKNQILKSFSSFPKQNSFKTDTINEITYLGRIQSNFKIIPYEIRINKECLLEFFECDHIWSNINKKIYSKELSYFIEIVKGNKKIRISKGDIGKLYDSIKKSFDNINIKGFNPDLMFISPDLKDLLLNYSGKLIRGQNFLEINKRKVKIVVVPLNLLKGVILLDSNIIHWTYKKYEDNNLAINFIETKNKLFVNLTVEIFANVLISNLNGIEIIKLG